MGEDEEPMYRTVRIAAIMLAIIFLFVHLFSIGVAGSSRSEQVYLAVYAQEDTQQAVWGNAGDEQYDRRSEDSTTVTDQVYDAGELYLKHDDAADDSSLHNGEVVIKITSVKVIYVNAGADDEYYRLKVEGDITAQAGEHNATEVLKLHIFDREDSETELYQFDHIALQENGSFLFEKDWYFPPELPEGIYFLQATFNGVESDELFPFYFWKLPPPLAKPLPDAEGSPIPSGSIEVELSMPEGKYSGAVIYYTTDGSDPTPDSEEYDGTIEIYSSYEPIRAVAVKDNVFSAEEKYVYRFSHEECFIATAAYGSSAAPAVGLLRQFRDRHLLSHGPGRLAVQFYELISPPLARIVNENEILKAAVRLWLQPLVYFAFLLQ